MSFTTASRVPLAALITTILLLSVPEHTSGETEESCPYQYTVVPRPEYNCNPIGHTSRLPLSCSAVQTALGPPNPLVQLRWYWTPIEENAGVSGIWILETTYGEFEYFLREEIHTTPVSQMLLSTITFDFNVNNTGYYWCQVALDQNTLLSPSTVIFIEQRSSLIDCKNNELSASLTESDGICAQPLSSNTNSSESTTATPQDDSSDSENNTGLLVWQSLVGAVLGIAILVVLMFSLVSVYSVRRARKRSAQARPTGGIPNATSQTELLSRASSRYAIAPIQLEGQEAASQEPRVTAAVETNSTNSEAETSQPRITSASIAMYTVPNGVTPLHLEMGTFLQNRNVDHYEPLRRETVDYLNVYSSCVQKNMPALSESESVYSDGAEKQLETQEVAQSNEPYPTI